VTVSYFKEGKRFGGDSGQASEDPDDPSRTRIAISMSVDLGELPRAGTMITIRANVGGKGDDDDGLAIDLGTLWQTLVTSRTTDSAYPFPKTMLDVYIALAGHDEDLDGDGVGDVTGLFIRHGFFADIAGGTSDRVHQADENDVGKTSHTANGTYVAMLDRPSRFAAPEELATIDTGGVPARIQVQVAFPGEQNDRLGYAYLAQRTPDGKIQLFAPPVGMGARLTLLALADGYDPKTLGQIDVDTYWKDVEHHDGQTFLNFSVTLSPAQVASPAPSCRFARDCASAPSPAPGQSGPEPLLLAGLLGLIGVLVVAASGLVVVTRRRRLATTSARLPVQSAMSPPPVGSPPPGGPLLYRATHVAPPGGVAAWSAPDSTRQPDVLLDPGLDVMVTETLPTGWAHITCSNGWSGWVEGRMLVPLT
jgi:hypothetical protein